MLQPLGESISVHPTTIVASYDTANWSSIIQLCWHPLSLKDHEWWDVLSRPGAIPPSMIPTPIPIPAHLFDSDSDSDSSHLGYDSDSDSDSNTIFMNDSDSDSIPTPALPIF